MKLARSLLALNLAINSARAVTLVPQDDSRGLRGQNDQGRKLPGGKGKGKGKGKDRDRVKDDDKGAGGDNGDDVSGQDEGVYPGQGIPTGDVIVGRKSTKKLRKEGYSPAEVAQMRSKGFSKIENSDSTLISESAGGDDDFQVVRVGRGKEKDFMQRLIDEDADGLFEFVEEDMIWLPDIVPNDDSQLLANSYHHTVMQSYDAWEIETGSAAVTVAICDTGLQTNHPDLAANRLPGYHAPSQTWEADGGAVEAVHPHGTNCAGCAAAIGNNSIGLSGVGWNFKHRPGRVTDSPTGGASSSALADCARKMCELPDVKVSSVSYSGVEGSARRAAATHCKDHGALMVNAAGNDNRDLTFAGDADDDDLIVAGASTSSDTRSGFSAYGAFVDVWAPGSSVWTTNTGSTYSPVSGTSFSCPLVAGLIALIWSKNPELSPNQVESVLKTSTDNVGIQGPFNTSYGRINSLKAVQAAGSGTPFPTQSPVTPQPTQPPTTAAPTTAAPTCSDCASLTTTFAQNNGSNGNMFKVQALNDVLISRLSIHTSDTNPGTVQVWERAGDYAGFETNSNEWNNILSETGFSGAGQGQASELDSFSTPVFIAAGSFHSFYVAFTSGVGYTNGDSEGSVFAQDSNLIFYEGVGKSGVFGNTYRPRVWNGIISYVESGTTPATPPPTAPSTPSPTSSSPTPLPTPSTTDAPVTPPPTPSPTDASTPSPTSSQTNAPTVAFQPTFLTCSQFDETACVNANQCQWLGSCHNCGCVLVPQN